MLPLRVDLHRENNPIFEQFLKSFDLKLEVEHLNNPNARNNSPYNLFDRDGFDGRKVNTRSMLDNPHAPKDGIAKLVLQVPNYYNKTVE